MSKPDDPALVRAAVLQRLKVHVRIAQQGLAPTPDQRRRLAASLPELVAFGDRRYAQCHAVLDWDHRLPSDAAVLRLYLSYTDREAGAIESALKSRDREIDAGNLYPEFDVPDYADVDASESYVAVLKPGTHEVGDLRFFSDWRKGVHQSVAREAVAAVRTSPSYERSMRERSHDNLGPPVVIGWTPPCLAQSKHWAIEVWLLVDFDGHVGRAHVFMVDSKSHLVTREYFTEVQIG
ncbi:hypothetical protein [Nannocystis bainbridge]|uniref:MmyB-like transcription regulator ligand binding domain-containing protein n=1 Tax=Nannocystis bainbridge TaxID=2995303 RepID=A0ABT5DXZ0_9BACT|nr:hypothetical protein [Nannocystis bainbridge]MDC0718033.1 hypothetical protein [Nannocystis bainbridge]